MFKKHKQMQDKKSDVSDEQQPLILLSTCYGRDSDSRYVVFARLEKNVKD